MPGLQVKYSKLFSISIQQHFYVNGIAAKSKVSSELDFCITPTQASRTLLNRLDWVCKTDIDNGGIIVLGRVKTPAPGPNEELYFKPKQKEILTFFISLKNIKALNFNDLPVLLSSKKVFYFNNKVSDGAASRDDLHLSVNAVGVADADTVVLSTGNYSYIHTSTIGVGTAKVRHIDTAQELLPKSLLNEGGQGYLTFDMSRFPSGLCELLIGGVSTQTFFNTKEAVHADTFGIIECALEALPLANYRIIESDGTLINQRPVFSIKLINRSTRWRYKVILDETSPLYREIDALTPAEKAAFYAQMNVVSNDTAVVFAANVISDTEFEFVSNADLALKEKYQSSSSVNNDTLIMNLKKYIGVPAKEDNIKVNLPYPPTDSLDATGFPTIYSDILLNL